MALPTTVVAENMVGGYAPTFKSNAGNFYVVAHNSTGTVISIFKTTDPTVSWTIQDTGDPNTSATAWSAVQRGDLIHIAWFSNNAAYIYAQFDMSDDTWGTGGDINQTIEDPANDPTNAWISISVRDDGDVVVVYAGDTDQVMGGKKERVDVNIRTAGTWGGPVALDAAGDLHYAWPNCVKATDSDDIHIAFGQLNSSTEPHGGTIEEKQARTLRGADNTLSTVVTATDVNPSFINEMGNGYAFADSSGNQKIRFSGSFENSTPVNVTQIYMLQENTGTGDIEFETTQFVTINDTAHESLPGGNSLMGLSDDLWMTFVNADDSNDLWYVTSTDGGSTWATAEVELADAIAGSVNSANIYQRGAQLVLAVVYDDGTNTIYDEVNITTPAMTNLSDATLTGLVNTHVGPFEI